MTHALSFGDGVRKLLGMALLGLSAIVLAGPLAIILIFASIGWLARGVIRMVVGDEQPLRVASHSVRGIFPLRVLRRTPWLAGRVVGSAYRLGRRGVQTGLYFASLGGRGARRMLHVLRIRRLPIVVKSRAVVAYQNISPAVHAFSNQAAARVVDVGRIAKEKVGEVAGEASERARVVARRLSQDGRARARAAGIICLEAASGALIGGSLAAAVAYPAPPHLALPTGIVTGLVLGVFVGLRNARPQTLGFEQHVEDHGA